MRRHKIDVTQEILVLCREPRKVTEIMRFANIGYYAFNQYVDPLVGQGFLIQIPCEKKNEDSRTRYKWMTTARGKVLLGELGTVLGKLKA